MGYKMFDFVCRRCGNASEALLAEGEAAPVCPVCGHAPMERRFTVAGLNRLNQPDAVRNLLWKGKPDRGYYQRRRAPLA